MTTTPTPDLSSVPSPESLRPLLEAALAVMEPNDPAQERLTASMSTGHGAYFCYRLHFYFVEKDGQLRDVFAGGTDPKQALEEFTRKYIKPVTRESQIAFYRAELAKLEAIE